VVVCQCFCSIKKTLEIAGVVWRNVNKMSREMTRRVVKSDHPVWIERAMFGYEDAGRAHMCMQPTAEPLANANLRMLREQDGSGLAPRCAFLTPREQRHGSV
jgi:hypothetical protein